MVKERLTRWQAELLADLVRLSTRARERSYPAAYANEGPAVGWVQGKDIGATRTMFTLMDKGHVEHMEKRGPRGGVIHWWRPLS